ncbi:MAG TPA: hypothetical protein DIS79_00295 [Bacteroidetes bacterium]|nr:hypothetical protein [Bacteroidota bacterium]HRK05174.1 TRIC cation channel family protein [Chlorobiota bacterium]
MDTFELPAWWDYAATFLYALVGARFAILRGYDVIGVYVLAFVAGGGGGLLRDMLLQSGPPVVLRDPVYVTVAWAAATAGLLLHRLLPRIQKFIDIVDAVSIGLYAVVGAQKSLLLGFSPLTAIFVGTLNAVGGGIIRDIIVRNEPDIFRPGTYYAVAVVAGVFVFVGLNYFTPLDADTSALFSVAVTVNIRALALRYGWKTRRLG